MEVNVMELAVGTIFIYSYDNLDNDNTFGIFIAQVDYITKHKSNTELTVTDIYKISGTSILENEFIITSEANFKVLEVFSTELAHDIIDKDNIFIKDLLIEDYPEFLI